MWIKELAIYNIQSFQKAKFQFSKGVNILVGKNNSGKSTVLRSLLNFQINQNQNGNNLLRKFESEGFVFALMQDSKGIRYGGNNTIQDDILGLYFDAKGGVISYFQPPDPFYDFEVLRDYLISLKKDLKGFDRIHNADGIFYPYLSNRKPQYFSSQFDKDSIKRIETDLRTLPAKIQQLNSSTLRMKFEDYCKSFIGFTPTIMPPSSNNPSYVNAGHSVGPSEDDWVPFDQMGAGTIQTTGFVANLLVKGSRIYLMEELETDLHPHLLKKLLDLIIEYSEKYQFIITTHSNIVLRHLGSLPNSKVIEIHSELVKNQGSSTELFTSTQKTLENSPSDRIRVLRELGYEFSDFELFEGFLILEEPSAEIIINEILIPDFIPHLKGKLRTVASKGASDVAPRFIELHRLFTYIHRSPVYKDMAWVLVDGDTAGKKAIEELKEKFKSWDVNHFESFAKNDFEEYYPKGYESQLDRIHRESDGEKRGILKIALAKEIVQKYWDDKSGMKVKFYESAAEVIEKLKIIESKLKSIP